MLFVTQIAAVVHDVYRFSSLKAQAGASYIATNWYLLSLSSVILVLRVSAGRPVQDGPTVPVHGLAGARRAQIWRGIH